MTESKEKIITIPKVIAVEIGNFKSFKENELITLEQLSLFAGLNGAGKSSIAQIILLISQTIALFRRPQKIKAPYLKLNGELIKIGTPSEILNNLKESLRIGFYFDDKVYIGFDFQFELIREEDFEIVDDNYLLLKNIYIEKKDSKDKDDDFKFQATYKKNVWEITADSCISFADRQIQNFVKDYFNKKWNECLNKVVHFTNIKDLSFYTIIPDDFKLPVLQFTQCITEERRNKFSIQDFIEKAKENEINLQDTIELSFNPALEVRKHLIEIEAALYIEPFRGRAQRIYSNDDKNPMLFINKTKNTKVPYNFNFESNTIEYETYENALTYWLNKLEIADEVHVNQVIEDFVSETILKKNNKEIAINNEGFGISQVLPLIARCLLDSKGLYMVDEPEVHLHPGLQADIGQFLFTMAMLGKHIIIETHSESIINQIKYLTLLYPDKKDKVISCWVYKGNEIPKVKTIEYDEYGFADNPPDGFFDQTAKILKQIRKIRQEKMFSKENE